MSNAGFEVMGDHRTPICPIRFTDEKIASKISEALLNKGILVTALSYPEVP